MCMHILLVFEPRSKLLPSSTSKIYTQTHTWSDTTHRHRIQTSNLIMCSFLTTSQIPKFKIQSSKPTLEGISKVLKTLYGTWNSENDQAFTVLDFSAYSYVTLHLPKKKWNAIYKPVARMTRAIKDFKICVDKSPSLDPRTSWYFVSIILNSKTI